MNKRNLSYLVAAIGLLACTGPAFGATNGTDNAAASPYNPTWDNGDNGAVTGSPFGPWNLSTSNGGSGSNAGFFIGDSTSLNGTTGANINTSGKSFGLYGKNPSGGSQANAIRDFSGSLLAGQSFSISLAVNFRNGIKGLDLRDSNGNAIFNFNIGGDDYVVQFATTGNGSIGNAYSNNTSFQLTFTQTTNLGGTWQITRAGGVSDFDTGTYSGLASGFKLYAGSTDGGSADNLYANNLSISGVPEPATWLAGLLALGAGGSQWKRVRRRQVA